MATPSLAAPQLGPRRRPAFALMAAGPELPRARVLPLRGGDTTPRPGHSLVQPARAAQSPQPARAAGPIPQRTSLSSEQARLRRRNVLLALAGAAFLTLIGAVLVGGSMILLHLLIDAVLLAYVLLLVQYQREIELERTRQLPVLGAPAGHYARVDDDIRVG